MTKLEALARHLDISVDEIQAAKYDGNALEVGSQEYLVLTDEEAQERVTESIKDSLWAFKAEFISSHVKAHLNSRALQALEKMQAELCEDANPLIEAMIDDLDDFVHDAVSTDSRGHFLSSYDGEENQVGEFFIYRNN